jgi:hypothetical protein
MGSWAMGTLHASMEKRSIQLPETRVHLNIHKSTVPLNVHKSTVDLNDHESTVHLNV